NEEIERHLEISLDRRERRRDDACRGCGHGPKYDANTRGGGAFRTALCTAANPLMAMQDVRGSRSGGDFAGCARNWNPGNVRERQHATVCSSVRGQLLDMRKERQQRHIAKRHAMTRLG